MTELPATRLGAPGPRAGLCPSHLSLGVNTGGQLSVLSNRCGNGFPTQSQVKKEGEDSEARWGQWRPPSGDKGADTD